MTKCLVIGNKQIQPQPKRVIKFVRYLSSDNEWKEPQFKPCDFKFVELIAKGYHVLIAVDAPENIDLIYCYDNPDQRRNGFLVLGKWNDGVVEPD